jgi:hypothetical protein
MYCHGPLKVHLDLDLDLETLQRNSRFRFISHTGHWHAYAAECLGDHITYKGRWSTQTVCTFRTTGNVRWLPVQQLDDTDAGDDLGDQPNAAQQHRTAGMRVVNTYTTALGMQKGATDNTAFDAVGAMRCTLSTFTHRSSWMWAMRMRNLENSLDTYAEGPRHKAHDMHRGQGVSEREQSPT